MIESLNEYWNNAFHGCPPLGHLLRSTYPERWVRFHSLPESKRYAETESEYTEIFKRQNRLICDIAGSTEIILLTTSYNGSAVAPEIGGRGSAEILSADPPHVGSDLESCLAIPKIPETVPLNNGQREIPLTVFPKGLVSSGVPSQSLFCCS